MSDKDREELDHPCRDTCSGWKQGYERGRSESQVPAASREELIRGIVIGFNPDGSQEVLFTRIAEEAYDAAMAQHQKVPSKAAAPQASREELTHKFYMSEAVKSGRDPVEVKSYYLAGYDAATAQCNEAFLSMEDRHTAETMKLINELAREKEKTKALVEALDFVSTDNYEDAKGMIRPTLSAKMASDALAKHREES